MTARTDALAARGATTIDSALRRAESEMFAALDALTTGGTS